MEMKVTLSYVSDEGQVDYEKEIHDESMSDLIKIFDYISDLQYPEDIVYVNEAIQ
jgi:hypothetical protein